MEDKESLNIIFESIAKTIKNTVLILGPELSVNENGEDYKTHFKNIEAVDSSVTKYFEKENLFLFGSRSDGRRLRRKVSNFYENVGDPILLDLISQVKFPLVINVCPDMALSKVLQAKNSEFATGFFKKKASVTEDFPTPTVEKPVIYNICGSVEDEFSLIVSHGNLYESMQYLLPPDSLPEPIEIFLKEAKRYIFLGFRFESWHYQLICQKLKINAEDEAGNDIISSPNCTDKEFVSFVMDQHFDMKFTNTNPAQTMEKLIKICEQKWTENLREPGVFEKFSCYISYKWRDADDGLIHKASVVDWLEKRFPEIDSRAWIKRDSTVQTYGDSIDLFMNLIGKGKTVIRVVSDRYLKSEYCMDEAMRMRAYDDDEKRILTVVIDDVKRNDLGKLDIAYYKKYWEERASKLFKQVQNESVTSKNEVLQKNQIYFRILDFIESFMDEVADDISLYVKYEDMQLSKADDLVEIVASRKGDFDRFVQAVIDKMK